MCIIKQKEQGTLTVYDINHTELFTLRHNKENYPIEQLLLDIKNCSGYVLNVNNEFSLTDTHLILATVNPHELSIEYKIHRYSVENSKDLKVSTMFINLDEFNGIGWEKLPCYVKSYYENKPITLYVNDTTLEVEFYKEEKTFCMLSEIRKLLGFTKVYVDISRPDSWNFSYIILDLPKDRKGICVDIKTIDTQKYGANTIEEIKRACIGDSHYEVYAEWDYTRSILEDKSFHYAVENVIARGGIWNERYN